MHLRMYPPLRPLQAPELDRVQRCGEADPSAHRSGQEPDLRESIDFFSGIRSGPYLGTIDASRNVWEWLGYPLIGRRFERIDEVYLFRFHAGRITNA